MSDERVDHVWAGTDDGHNCSVCVKQDDSLHMCWPTAHLCSACRGSGADQVYIRLGFQGDPPPCFWCEGTGVGGPAGSSGTATSVEGCPADTRGDR
jgi:hypothetical protein